MSTNFVHRFIIVAPSAKAVTIATWANANLTDAPNVVSATLGPGLSADGNTPATANWCCFSCIDADAKAVIVKLCQLGSVTPPTNPQWNGWTGAQKRSFLAGVQAAIKTNYGVFVTLADNVGIWDDPTAALAAMGLLPVTNG